MSFVVYDTNVLAAGVTKYITAYAYNFQCTYNPLDKIVELYERLLASEKEKVKLQNDK